jgi:hypothetical protein
MTASPRRDGRRNRAVREAIYLATPGHTCTHCHRTVWLNDPTEIGLNPRTGAGRRAVAGHITPHATDPTPLTPDRGQLECADCSNRRRQEARIAAQQRAATTTPTPTPPAPASGSGTTSATQPAGGASFLGAGVPGRGRTFPRYISRDGADLEWPESDPDDWRAVPWVAPLVAEFDRDDTAVWPRFMSGPHPDAVGSYGAEFAAFAADRSGSALYWWQRLVAARLLEHRTDGSLCWDRVLLTVARQLGKTHLMRELMFYRLHLAGRIGQTQSVLLFSVSLGLALDVCGPGLSWAQERKASGWKAWSSNLRAGVQDPDGNKWTLVTIATPRGRTSGLVIVDEAWDIKPAAVRLGIEPTLARPLWPQLIVTSTADPAPTATVPDRRRAAMRGRGLLLEWSAPPRFALDDVAGWRAASPLWTPQQRALMAARFADIGEAGSGSDDAVMSFETQWLNRWPASVATLLQPGEPLVGAGDWVSGDADPAGAFVFAVQDRTGGGVAVAYAHPAGAGRVLVDARPFAYRADAYEWLRQWVAHPRVAVRQVLAGFDVYDDAEVRDLAELVPVDRAGAAETRAALALMRQLTRRRQVVSHSADLDGQVAAVRVVEGALGLRVKSDGPWELVQAAAWAVAAVAREREPVTPGVW